MQVRVLPAEEPVVHSWWAQRRRHTHGQQHASRYHLIGVALDGNDGATRGPDGLSYRAFWIDA
ncbi:MAG: hypothetical protein JO057_30750 [Chloroflexi bacterium]|nr:hypothetical protein [Chloroflexota bacterium]